jgi:hypothetical protein
VSTVSAETASTLQEAMQRLLEGRPSRTDGALTIANLARKAGVSRATANRASDIIDRFRARLGMTAGEDLPATGCPPMVDAGQQRARSGGHRGGVAGDQARGPRAR